MPARKKTRKKQTKTSRVSAKRVSGRKKPKVTRGKAQTRPNKNKAVKKKAAAKKRSVAKASRASKPRNRNQTSNRISARATRKADSGLESGDLQGLGTLAEADSESARELLEEGNAFEADVVSGIEEAGDKPEREVRPRQVPEDDVPEEYLDSE